MNSYRLLLVTLVATALFGVAQASRATELFHFTFDGSLNGTTYTNDSASTKTGTVTADNNGGYPVIAGGAISFTNNNNGTTLNDEILTVDVGTVQQQQSFIMEVVINPFSTTQGTGNTGNLATLIALPGALDLRFNGGTGAAKLEGVVKLQDTSWKTATSADAISANRDTHVALVYTDSITAPKLQLYINGVASGAAINYRVASGDNSNDIGIGNLGSTSISYQSRGFDGLIKEAAMSTFTGTFNPGMFVIPEPSTWALVMGGLLLFVTTRRSRRAARSTEPHTTSKQAGSHKAASFLSAQRPHTSSFRN